MRRFVPAVFLPIVLSLAAGCSSRVGPSSIPEVRTQVAPVQPAILGSPHRKPPRTESSKPSAGATDKKPSGTKE
jgi:hypothetical protein